MNTSGCLYPFFALFAIAGLACGAWGVHSVLNENRILSEGLTTTGTIVELVRSSKGNSVAPLVAFRDQDGRPREYQASVYSGFSDYRIGQQMTVHYLPDSPDKDVVLGGMSWMAYFPLIFLITHGGIGIGGLIWLERRRRRRNWLLNNGQEVSATLVRVATHQSKSDTYYTIVSEWKDPLSGEIYTYTSDSQRSDPTGWLAEQGNLVQVLIDPNDPKRYWMRLD